MDKKQSSIEQDYLAFKKDKLYDKKSLVWENSRLVEHEDKNAE